MGEAMKQRVRSGLAGILAFLVLCDAPGTAPARTGDRGRQLFSHPFAVLDSILDASGTADAADSPHAVPPHVRPGAIALRPSALLNGAVSRHHDRPRSQITRISLPPPAQRAD